MRRKLKIYENEELAALNAFLRQRSELPIPNNGQFLHVCEKFFITTDIDGVEWMTRKEGPTEYRKLFELKAWRRFNWGQKHIFVRGRNAA